MKTLFKLIVILLLPAVSSMAQEYLPFPKDSAVWYTVKSWPEYDPPPLFWFKTYKYEANGDTSISEVGYTKLYRKLVFGTEPAEYVGAYRIDVETDRVYYLDGYYGTESLLYDFSLVPGDTIIISGTEYEPFNLVCLDTSTMIINNIPHHSYFIYSYLSNGTECYTTWVKGIGSLRMPIETDWFCAGGFEGQFDLSCFYYKDEHIYEWIENPYFEGCIGTNVGIDEFVDKSIFTIAPNPVASTSRLITDSSGNSLFDFQVIDINGKMLQSGSNVESADIIIQNSRFNKGLYVLRLYAHQFERYYSIKFIIN